MYTEVVLYNAIIKWFEDAFIDWESTDDPDWIEYVCNEIGITETEYKRIMGLESKGKQMRYEATLGFNTKQWWAYDNETDEYCDPPSSVLEEIKAHSDDVDEQEKFFNEILATEPDWLNDEDYRYDDIEI